jgi:hypothetical protein
MAGDAQNANTRRSAALMNRGGRYLAALILAMLAAPALALFAAPYETRSAMERRMLAEPPSLPASVRDWTLLPRRLDAWFADHFAWRGAMVRLSLNLEAAARLKPRGGLDVVEGKDGWLLLNPGLLGLTGGETRPAAAERYGAYVCDLAQAARARGATFLFAPAPGAAEIYPEVLPGWLPQGAPTQTDLVLGAARACGVDPLDLRPLLREAKPSAQLYQRRDSHWTERGALVAFDAVARRLGQPWALDPKALPWQAAARTDSDLARLSGQVAGPGERMEVLPTAPEVAGAVGDLPHGIYPPAFQTLPPRPVASVLIVGDSYAGEYMSPLFWRAGVSMTWIHQAECRFDRRVLDRLRFDVVLLMPSSRFAECR